MNAQKTNNFFSQFFYLWSANTVTCLPMSIICIRDTIISSTHTFMSGPSMNILTYFPYIRSPLTNILRAYCDIRSVFFIISRAFVDMYSARFTVLSNLRCMWFIFLSFGITFTTVDCLWTLTQHRPPAAMLWAVQEVWWANFLMIYPQCIAGMLVFKSLRFLWSHHFRTKWTPSFKKLGFQRFPSDMQMRKSTHTLFWGCQTAVWWVWV